MSSLAHFDVDLIFDVGANIGQYGQDMRTGGYKGKIVSFEPIASAHAQLLLSAARDPLWTVHPRCALGDHEEKKILHIANNLVSSSLLPMCEAHKLAAPNSYYNAEENVDIHTLDHVAPYYLQSTKAPFLKLDVQGYESNVLEGAVQTLPKLRGVIVELSMLTLYEGQELWQSIIYRLENAGFTLWAIHPVFNDNRSGRTLQVNATFYRH